MKQLCLDFVLDSQGSIETHTSYSGIQGGLFIMPFLLTITDKENFEKVSVYIIAPQIRRIRKNAVDLKYEDNIRMYSIENEDFVELIG